MKSKLFIVIIIVLGILLWTQRTPKPSQLSDAEILERSWQTFETYLKAAQSHSIEAIGDVSYKLSSACTDPSQEVECFRRMDLVYDVGKDFKLDDFKNIWADDKQVILFTDWIELEDDYAKAYSRQYILLARNPDNTFRIFSFSLPDQRAFLFKGDLTEDEVETRLLELREDLDQDFVPDEVETCFEQGEECEETDPNDRDTDNDGWWDGIEPYLERV